MLFISILVCVLFVGAMTYSIVERHRRHQRNEHLPGDTVGAMIDGAIIASVVDDLIDD